MSNENVVRTARTKQARLIPLADFGSQQGPNDAIIHAIHREPDGHIPLATKTRDGDWKELGVIAPGQPFFRELSEQLDVNSYFGLNASFRTGKRKTGTRSHWQPAGVDAQVEGFILPDLALDFPGATIPVKKATYRSTHPETGLPYQDHTIATLRWLTVCYVDIDCYRQNISVGDAIGALVNMQDAGQIPTATMFARSGRGVWAFWFLVDHRNPEEGAARIYGVPHTPHTPQRASKDAIALYAKIQRALIDRLAFLGADRGATDAARLAPVPGTLKTTTGVRVEYWVQGAQGHAFAYTLRELAEALAIPLLNREHPVIEAALRDAPRNEARAHAGRRGWIQRHRNLLADLHILLNYRGGGFDEGHRNIGAVYYAIALSKSHGANGERMDTSEIRRRVERFGRLCRPPLKADEVRAALATAKKAKANFLASHARLVQELKITPQELQLLSYIRPRTPRATTGVRTTTERRKAIAAIVAASTEIPTTRRMADILKGQGFDIGNHSTIARDYKTLGYTVANKGGRPKKNTLFN